MDGVTVIEGTPEDTGDIEDTESFEEELQAAMITPISDESSASAVVPLIIRGPAEALDKIRWISASRSFDDQHTARSDKVLDRILAGLDIPKETVAGIADSKYANATVVEESLLRDHVEPMILQVVDALTIVFFKPVLRSLGWTEEETRKLVIWYDPSAITTKPSKAEAANVGYNQKTISGKAWRRANGFTEGDKPTELEIAQRMASERGLLSEAVTEALLHTLIPTLLDKVKSQQQAAAGDAGQIIEQIDGNDVPDPNGLIEPGTPETEEEPPSDGPDLIEP